MLHHDISRRAFLQKMRDLAGTFALAGLCPRQARAATTGASRLIIGADTALYSIDLRSHIAQKIDLGFIPHSFVQNPIYPERVWALEHWHQSENNSAAEIDLTRMEVIRQIQSPLRTQFYGHGAFSSTADLFFIVCVNSDSGEGHLLGYETTNYKPVLDYHLTPGAIHDCHLLPDHTLLIANYGGKITIPHNLPVQYGPMIEASSLIRVDLSSGRILNRITIEESDRILTHFAVTTEGSIVATGGHIDHSPKGGAVHFGHLDSASLKRVALPASTESSLIFGIQNVSLDDQNHLAAISNQEGTLVLFVDTKNGQFMGEMKMKKPHAISYNPNTAQFICSSDDGLILFDKTMHQTQGFSLDPAGKSPPLRFNSAHSLLI